MRPRAGPCTTAGIIASRASATAPRSTGPSRRSPAASSASCRARCSKRCLRSKSKAISAGSCRFSARAARSATADAAALIVKSKLGPPALGSEIELWHADLAAAARRSTDFYWLLIEYERVRAARVHDGERAARFIAGRGLLRMLWARRTDRHPATLRFEYGARGGPALVPTPGEAPCSFNLAHSGSSRATGDHRCARD